MTEWNDMIKDEVIAELDSFADELHLEPADAGEGKVLVTAVVAGLTRPESIEPTVLNIVGHKEGICIEVRNICLAGSPGATVNRTVSSIMARIFMMPGNNEETNGSDQIELCGLHADMFRSANRTSDDLVAMIVAASNGVTLRTSAAIDFRDGEVLVNEFVPCTPNELPEDLRSPLGRVLQHAALVQQTAYVIRDLLSPGQAPAPRVMAKLFEKLRSPEKIEPAEREAVEEVTL